MARYLALEPEDFASVIRDATMFLLDVRTPEEFAEGHISGAAIVDFNLPDFTRRALSVIPPGMPVALYCRSGRRSELAARALADAGVPVTDLEGGILAWLEKQLPVEH